MANHFDLPGSESIFGISQDLPMCVHTSLSQDGFYRRGLWIDLASFSISPLLTSKEPFCACVVGEVSWLLEWEICGLLSSIWAGRSLLSQLSCCSCLGVSVHREWTPAVCPGGPSNSCLSAEPESKGTEIYMTHWRKSPLIWKLKFFACGSHEYTATGVLAKYRDMSSFSSQRSSFYTATGNPDSFP